MADNNPIWILSPLAVGLILLKLGSKEPHHPKNTITEKQKEILEEIRVAPLSSPEEIRKKQLYELKLFEDKRDKKMEEALKDFAKQITDEIGINSPEVIAVPRLLLLQITDGDTDVGTYWNSKETIYINRKDSTLYDFCHELKHHIDFKQRGRDQMVESMKCMYERTPHWDCPTEERARKFAMKCIVSDKYRSDWKKKVEKIIGSKRIMRWKED